MQRRNLACLANLAERLECPVDCRQRDMRMEPAHGLEYRFGAGMIGGVEQRFDNRHALRRHREPTLAAATGEFRHSALGVCSASILTDYLPVHY
jgi:hypothetical protein